MGVIPDLGDWDVDVGLVDGVGEVVAVLLGAVSCYRPFDDGIGEDMAVAVDEGVAGGGEDVIDGQLAEVEKNGAVRQGHAVDGFAVADQHDGDVRALRAGGVHPALPAGNARVLLHDGVGDGVEGGVHRRGVAADRPLGGGVGERPEVLRADHHLPALVIDVVVGQSGKSVRGFAVVQHHAVVFLAVAEQQDGDVGMRGAGRADPTLVYHDAGVFLQEIAVQGVGDGVVVWGGLVDVGDIVGDGVLGHGIADGVRAELAVDLGEGQSGEGVGPAVVIPQQHGVLGHAIGPEFDLDGGRAQGEAVVVVLPLLGDGDGGVGDAEIAEERHPAAMAQQAGFGVTVHIDRAPVRAGVEFGEEMGVVGV